MSKMIILHAADLHLDSPFEGLPAAPAAQRRQEQRELLKTIAHTADAERADHICSIPTAHIRKLPRIL